MLLSIGIGEKFRKNTEKRRKKTQKKYCVQSGDNIYPENGRFSIADSNVTYRSLLKAFAQANIRNPILPIRRLRFNGQPYKNKSKPRADRTTSKSRVWCVITIKYEKGNLRKKIINFYLNIMRRQITTYEKNFSSSLIFNWLLYFFWV